MVDTNTEHSDRYYTIEARNRIEFKEKGSKFIATAIPIATKEQAMEEVDAIQREFFDATHNCFAYRLGIDGLIFRAVDDGEPSGSAGKPILFAIQRYAVSDTLVVVTRYFGKTKLGVKNLARAYASSTELVLQSCTKKAMYRTGTVKVFTTYEDLKLVLPLVEKYAVYTKSDYRDAVEFELKIMISDIPLFMESINTVTNARAGCVMESED